MVAEPGSTPVTMPEAEPTDAVEELLLNHVPPVTSLVKVIFVPVQTVDGPEIVPAVMIVVIVITLVAKPDPQVPVTW